MSICRKPYPSDVSDEEWLLVAPYLLLQREDARRLKRGHRRISSPAYAKGLTGIGIGSRVSKTPAA